ncbi:effector-associated constant component EACC1 [Streptomyces lydicus]|uniref:effector-associated constant component EACC1 n=1 Tax=Streptomyces lydicus TaxID=47763 RepID=UPI003723BE1B
MTTWNAYMSDNGDGSTMEGLTDWLRREPELRGKVKMHSKPIGEGDLGAAADIAIVAVGSGGAMTVLAQSLKAWLSRPRRSRLRISLESEQGIRMEVEADHPEDVERLLRELSKDS